MYTYMYIVYWLYAFSNSSYCICADEMLADGSPLSDIIEHCQQCIETDPVSDVDITIILWHCIMSAVEWNKKEDLLAKQAMEHLQVVVNAYTLLSLCIITSLTAMQFVGPMSYIVHV